MAETTPDKQPNVESFFNRNHEGKTYHFKDNAANIIINLWIIWEHCKDLLTSLVRKQFSLVNYLRIPVFHEQSPGVLQCSLLSFIVKMNSIGSTRNFANKSGTILNFRHSINHYPTHKLQDILLHSIPCVVLGDFGQWHLCHYVPQSLTNGKTSIALPLHPRAGQPSSCQVCYLCSTVHLLKWGTQ